LSRLFFAGFSAQVIKGIKDEIVELMRKELNEI
jgi:hypothetical protein